MDKIIMKKLFNYLNLGKIVKEPQQVFGGLLHKMYKVETSSGTYAVKALNPIIMKREMAASNTIFSEKVSKIAFRNNIPAVVAHEKEGCIHDIDGSYFMVFDWVDAKNITHEQTTVYNCKTIGKLLAQLHSIDFSEIADKNNDSIEPFTVDWQKYCSLCTGVSLEIEVHLVKLEYWTSLVDKSVSKICDNQVISHRDMDCKNVLWDENDSPFVIDWESAGYINPLVELIDVALAWSGMSADKPNIDKFKAVVSSYINNGGTIDDNVKGVLDYGYIGKLQWLEYNIKRALGIECSDEEECELGRKQVYGTLRALEEYEQMIPIIDNILKEYIKE